LYTYHAIRTGIKKSVDNHRERLLLIVKIKRIIS